MERGTWNVEHDSEYFFSLFETSFFLKTKMITKLVDEIKYLNLAQNNASNLPKMVRFEKNSLTAVVKNERNTEGISGAKRKIGSDSDLEEQPVIKMYHFEKGGWTLRWRFEIMADQKKRFGCLKSFEFSPKGNYIILLTTEEYLVCDSWTGEVIINDNLSGSLQYARLDFSETTLSVGIIEEHQTSEMKYNITDRYPREMWGLLVFAQ